MTLRLPTSLSNSTRIVDPVLFVLSFFNTVFNKTLDSELDLDSFHMSFKIRCHWAN